MRISLFLLAVGVCVISTGVRTQEHTITAVATVKQLCEGMITASSDAIFNVGRDVPSNDEAWLSVHNSALMLAESGNLLMMEGRSIEDEDWMKHAKQLVDVGTAAFEAAGAHDLDAIIALNAELESSCRTCHEQYHPRYRRRGQDQPDQ